MDVTMPQLGETVTEGTITRWFKQVGEHDRCRRAAVRGLDRQGRLRGSRAERGRRVRDPRARGRDRRGRRPPRGDLRRRRPAPAPAAAPRRPEPATATAAARQPAPAGRAGADPGGVTGNPRGASRRRVPANPTIDSLPTRRNNPRPRPRRAATAPATAGIVASPLVRRLITEHGLDPATIRGTGEGGRITRNDVLAAARDGQPAPAARTAPAPAAPAPAPHRAASCSRRRHRAPCRAGRRRRSRPVRQHPAPHGRARGAVEGHQRARIHVGARRLRAHRAHPARRAVGVEGERGLLAHVPPVHRARVLATSCTTTRT